MADDTKHSRADQREKEQKSAVLSYAFEELTSSDQHRKRDASKILAANLAEKINFHQEARPDGTLSADFRLMTEHLSPLLKSGAVVVDVGGSSGRFAEFLARARADVRVIAIEPDAERFALAQQSIREAGLENRVILLNQPIDQALTAIAQSNPGHSISAITSVYRTHLQTDAQNAADLKAISQFATTTGASIAMLDLHRAKTDFTADLMSKIFPADNASQEFRDVYRAALAHTAYRGPELEKMIATNMEKEGWDHDVSAVTGQFQMHIRPGSNAAKSGTAPEPAYPCMQTEYVKVADAMETALHTSNQFVSRNPLLKENAAQCARMPASDWAKNEPNAPAQTPNVAGKGTHAVGG